MCYKQLFSLVNLQHCKRKHRLHEIQYTTVNWSKDKTWTQGQMKTTTATITVVLKK